MISFKCKLRILTFKYVELNNTKFSRNNDNGVTTKDGDLHFDERIDIMNGNLSKLLKIKNTKNEYYRYVTYQFSHGDGIHLGGNILVQLLLGIPLEFMHGSWRIVVVYLAGVLSGSVCHVNFDINGLGGSSGGVYAMMTAHIASVLMVRILS